MWYKLTWIYVWQDKVRPSGWKPNANTLLYLPLESDIKDYSWNNRDVSSNNWMTQSTQKWVDCYYVANSWWISLSTSASSWLKSGWNYFTLLCWVYRPTNPSWSNRSFLEFAVRNAIYKSVSIVSWSSQIRTAFNQTWTNTGLYTWNSDWCLISLTIDNWTQTIYLNDGTSSYSWSDNNWWWGSWSSSSQQGCNLFAPRNWISNWEAFNWYVSNLIMENRAWTQQEVATYYNQTKSNYWL